MSTHRRVFTLVQKGGVYFSQGSRCTLGEKSPCMQKERVQCGGRKGGGVIFTGSICVHQCTNHQNVNRGKKGGGVSSAN